MGRTGIGAAQPHMITRAQQRIEARAVKLIAARSEALDRFEHGTTRKLNLALLPIVLRTKFDPTRAGDLEAILLFRLCKPDGEGEDPMTIRIAQGRCRIDRVAHDDPDASASLGLADMIRMAVGAVTPPQLWTSGRLTLTGDPYLFARFSVLFRAQPPKE
ncbi:SCP2 sterol-binding domain-containing protein [Nocardia sp. NPDC005825]|uniref:SCP2 sterol-binding domain-containing protein n=1 Tax=unclassified Nocardia TaxID=2637762 RepID=UPI0033E7E406